MLLAEHVVAFLLVAVPFCHTICGRNWNFIYILCENKCIWAQNYWKFRQKSSTAKICTWNKEKKKWELQDYLTSFLSLSFSISIFGSVPSPFSVSVFLYFIYFLCPFFFFRNFCVALWWWSLFGFCYRIISSCNPYWCRRPKHRVE